MTELLKCVCVTDEAISIEGMPQGRMLEYVEKRDFALIEPHIIPGSKPVLFFIREIPHSLFRWVMEQSNETARAYAAFQAGVARVENMRSADDALMTAEGLAHHKNGALEDKELERFDASEILEIGEVAFVRSFFRRKTERVYRLPPSLAERWVEQVARRAARNRALPDPSSDAA